VRDGGRWLADAGRARARRPPLGCSASGAGRTDGIVLLPLADLLATSDVVSVHLRLSDECRGLLGRDRLRMMKPGSVLVNTARGAVVDQQALIEVLRNGALSAAGLDVFTEEPP
jgi:D-3-phosphoglycerate dehydrogenase / 2-oxoglutarate reductase